MDRDGFWELVEAAGAAAAGDCDQQAWRLIDMLEQQAPEEIVAFHRHFEQLMVDAYRYDLWAVAIVFNGGCSEDCFGAFRAWLLAQGRAVWEAALRDPDSLVEADECWEMSGVAMEAYSLRAEAELPEDDIAMPDRPLGEQWDFNDDDEVRRRLPRVWARTRAWYGR